MNEWEIEGEREGAEDKRAVRAVKTKDERRNVTDSLSSSKDVYPYHLVGLSFEVKTQRNEKVQVSFV